MGACSSQRRRILFEDGPSQMVTFTIGLQGRRVTVPLKQIPDSGEGEPLNGEWEKVSCSGEMPCERSGHAVIVAQGKAYLFGGYGGANPCHLSDFYSFDFAKGAWETVRAPGGPCPRTAFAMCVTPDDFVYLWGGTDHDLQGLEDQELYEYDVYNSRWSLVDTVNKGILDLRYFGRSASYYKRKILYFGGGVKGGRFTNELIQLDLDSFRWERVPTTGDLPCPRYKHQACVVGDQLYVLGGGCYLPPEATLDVYCLDLTTRVWAKIGAAAAADGDELPEGRAAHTCEYDAATGALYLWGGFNQGLVPLFDFWRLDLRTHQWARAAPRDAADKPGAAWPGRSFHAACLHGGALYSFNGSDGESRYADLMRFRLHAAPAPLVDLALGALKRADGAALARRLRRQALRAARREAAARLGGGGSPAGGAAAARAAALARLARSSGALGGGLRGAGGGGGPGGSWLPAELLLAGAGAWAAGGWDPDDPAPLLGRALPGELGRRLSQLGGAGLLTAKAPQSPVAGRVPFS